MHGMSHEMCNHGINICEYGVRAQMGNQLPVKRRTQPELG